MADCLPPIGTKQQMNGFIPQLTLVSQELVDHLPDLGGSVGVTCRNRRLQFFQFRLQVFSN